MTQLTQIPTLFRILIVFFVISMTACSQHAVQTQKPANRAELSVKSYSTELAAVTAAARQYNDLSIAEDREYMGAIYQCDNRFYFSVGAGQSGAGNVTVTLVTPKGCSTTALWHTHGSAHYSHSYFSEIDTRLVEQTGKPFYMIDHTDTVRVFEPGDDTLSSFKASKLGLGKSNGYAKGDIVAKLDGQAIPVAAAF